MNQIDVLVIDDNEDVYISTKLALQLFESESRSINIDYSNSAFSAIEQLNRQKYNLLFVDIVMETEDAGFKVIEFIRNSSENKDSKIYIRSGKPGNVPEEFMYLLKGVDGYLEKTSVTINKLEEIINTIES